LPAACGGGQENPTARGQKISSPETPPFFAHSRMKRFTKSASRDIILEVK